MSAPLPSNVRAFVVIICHCLRVGRLSLIFSRTVSGITRIQGTCGARLIQDNNRCSFGIVPPGSANDRDFSDVNTEGATIKISTTPCVSGQICPGTVCGRITRPSTTGYDYTVTCASPITGTYLSIQLPGTGRILQLANVQINVDANSPTC